MEISSYFHDLNIKHPLSPAGTGLSERTLVTSTPPRPSYRLAFEILRQEISSFYKENQVPLPVSLLSEYGYLEPYAKVLERINSLLTEHSSRLHEDGRKMIFDVATTTLTQLLLRSIPAPAAVSNELGDIGLVWQKGRKYVAVEFDEDGDAVFGTSNHGKIGSGFLVTDGSYLCDDINKLPEMLR